MFEVQVKIGFSSSHHLVGYEGDCARQHGHNFVLEVHVLSDALDSVGMAVDFRVLKEALQELIQRWDHRDLNELEDFVGLNPTAENIARIVYKHLSKLGKNVCVDKVTVWENDRCAASYFERLSNASIK
ncbi:MAG: 6-carboxytetrahydropterin synthase QueD [Bdellovibrionota bacterium]